MKNNFKPDLRVFKPGKGKKFPHHTQKCVTCKRHLHRPEAICNFCGTCQRCETLNPDKFGNHCIHCNNFIEQGRYDKSAHFLIINHGLETPFLEPQEPKHI